MIVTCGSCQSKFRIDPARIPAQGARLRCPKCKGVIAVEAGAGTARGGGGPGAGGPSRAPDASGRFTPPTDDGSSPTAAAPRGTSRAPEGPRRFSPPRDPGASSTTVLVAHGNPAFGEQLRAFLERHGFATLSAADGPSAEALVRERRPPLLLVDAALPGLPGHLLCERLKQDAGPSRVKVVLVGAIYDRTRYRRPPQSLYGADGYVEKHQIAEELVPMLRRLLEGGSEAGGDAEAGADQIEASQAPGRFAPPKEESASLTAARRLARIIVSDIVLYNPDAVKRGLADGNLTELLADELKEGRDLLKARMGAEAAGHDFVLEALREYVQRMGARSAAAAR